MSDAHDPSLRERSLRFWGAIAPRRRALGLASADEIGQLLADLRCEPGASILDVGCGPGTYCIPLAIAGLRVRGIDFSPETIGEARALARDRGLSEDTLELAVGNAEQLDLVDASVDALVCKYVLGHQRATVSVEPQGR